MRSDIVTGADPFPTTSCPATRAHCAGSASGREMSADPDARTRLLLPESDLDACHGGLRVERDEPEMLLVRA